MRRLFSNIIFILAGIACIVVSVFFFSITANEKKTMTVETVGTVVSYLAQEEERTDSRGFITTEIFYYPVISYEVNGETYENKANVGSSEKQWDVGSEIEICYNPNSPDNYRIKGEKTSVITAFVFLGFGVVVLLSSAVSIIKSIR